LGFLDALVSPRAAIDHSDFELGDDWKSVVSDAGVEVTADTAMRHIAVKACVQLIADAIRQLPVGAYRKTQDFRVPVARRPSWLVAPNPDQTWGQFVDYALHSLLVYGNAFIFIVSRDFLGYPQDLAVIHPEDVEVDREDGPKRIRVSGKEFSEFNGRKPNGRVLHVQAHTGDGLVGLSPIEDAREAIGSGLAIEQFGNKFFANGAVSSGTIEMPPNSHPTPDQMQQTARQFDRRHKGLKNAHRPIVLANGASYKPMTVPPNEAQFIEAAKFNVEQIARLYRIPPHLISDVEKSTSWGTGIEQQGIGFVTYTLDPWITRLEEALNQLLPRGQFLKFNVNGLLRGDAAARGAFYQTMGTLKAMTINEIRALEDMPPFDDGDTPPPAPNESI
jgi:HK97 family phage portal protein